jgi:hypothetical protein
MIDFSLLQRPNPMQSLQQGMQTGANIAQLRQQKAKALQDKMFAAEEAQRKLDFTKAFNTAMSDNTSDNWARVMQLAPKDKVEAMRETWGKMDSDMKQNILNTNMQVLYTAKNNPDEAVPLLQSMVNAFEAKGNKQKANFYDQQLKKIQSGDPKAKQQAVSILTSIVAATPGGDKALKAMEEQEQSKRAKGKQAIDIYKTIKDLNITGDIKEKDIAIAKELGEESLADFLQFAGAKSRGDLTQDQYNKTSSSLRKEYNAEVEPLNTVIASTNKLRNLVAENTGFGTNAMISIFNKVIDPPSVVRESEAARTERAVSVMSVASNVFNKLKTGAALKEEERQKLVDAAELIEEIALFELKKQTDRYNSIATRAGIDIRDVSNIKSTANLKREAKDQAQSELDYRKALIARYGESYRDVIMGADLAELKKTYGDGNTIKVPEGQKIITWEPK